MNHSLKAWAGNDSKASGSSVFALGAAAYVEKDFHGVLYKDIMIAPYRHSELSPCLAVPHIRFLFIGSQFMFHACIPTLGRPHAVALHFARRNQLATGLAPVGVRPCWAHQKKKAAITGSLFYAALT